MRRGINRHGHQRDGGDGTGGPTGGCCCTCRETCWHVSTKASFCVSGSILVEWILVRAFAHTAICWWSGLSKTRSCARNHAHKHTLTCKDKHIENSFISSTVWSGMTNTNTGPCQLHVIKSAFWRDLLQKLCMVFFDKPSFIPASPVLPYSHPNNSTDTVLG